MAKESPEIETSFLETLGGEHALDLIAEAGEVALDTALDDGVLKDIPVFGSLLQLARAGITIRDRLFQKKLLRFLKEIASISGEDRERFLSRLRAEGMDRRLAEAILLHLERADDMNKAAILARIVRACAQGEINFAMTLRLCAAVDRAYYQDLLELPKADDGPGIDTSVAQSLANAGLMTWRVGQLARDLGETFFETNDLGRTLIRVALSEGTRQQSPPQEPAAAGGR